MRIAYLIGQYPAINHGYLLREVELLREAGFDIATVSISAPDRPATQLSPREAEAARTTFYIKSQPATAIAAAHLRTLVRRPLRYLRGLRRALAAGNLKSLFYLAEAVVVGEWMERERLTAVHISFSLGVGMPLLDVFDVRASAAIYGFGELTPPGSIALARLASRLRLIRCISRHSRSMAMLLSPPALWDRIVTAPLGAEIESFAPVPFRENPQPFTLTTVGRLAPEKAQALLIDVTARLRLQGREVRLRLVGDGPERAMLERRAEDLQIREAVIFEGRVDDARLLACYRESDAFVMTSLYEGIPIVLMEAMAMEIPCVAPRITGIPELIEDNVSGLLFHPADGGDLERALRLLIDNPARRRELAANGRKQVAAHYGMRRNTESFGNLFRGLGA